MGRGGVTFVVVVAVVVAVVALVALAVALAAGESESEWQAASALALAHGRCGLFPHRRHQRSRAAASHSCDESVVL